MATTTAPSALYRIFSQVDPHLKTVKMGGVVGDARHGSGYHLSRNALKARGLSGDYSIQCAADKRGPGDKAAAIDLTFGALAELVTVTKRLKKACEDNDPRVEAMREHIGTVDGKRVCGYNRVATGSGSRSRVGWTASGFSDSSHLWHTHISVLRAYVEDDNAMTGIAEVVAGLPAGALGWKGEAVKADPAGSYPRPADEVVYLSKVKVGQEDSDSIYWIQRALREAGFTKALKTGTYDANTVAAVKDLQVKLDDEPTGDLTDAQVSRLRGLAKTKWSIEAKA